MGENASFTMFVEIKNQRIPLHIGQWYLLGKQINGGESKANNFIKLDDEEDVEQKHCIIYVGHTEEVFLFDLFSSKGTLVNNTPLKGSEMLRLKNADILKVGNQEIKYIHDQQEMCHDSSGFLEYNKNTSDIIASSPDSTSQHESRVKRANYNNFLVPSIPPKTSVAPNTSLVIAATEANTSKNSLNSSNNSLNSTNRRSDSFTIPETQYCGPSSSLNASDLSVADSTPDVSENKIQFNFGNLDDDDEDFCIPETQELLPAAGITSSQRPRILSDGQFQEKSILLEESKNEAEDNNNIDGSQFRICTQDYNEGFGEEANQSQYSQIIPLIKHPMVILNNSAKSSNENSRNQSKAEDDEKDMSALKWSNSKLDQETTELRADCTTPDILDFEELQQESIEKDANKSNTEPPHNMLDEDDEDLLPTQVFLPSAPIKPTEKKSSMKPEMACVEKDNEEVLTLSDKENRCPVTLEPITDLPPTQLFATNEVPTARSTTSSTSRNSLTAPAIENKNNSKSLHNLDPDEEDDLLTQAFLQPTNLPSSSNHKNIPVKCFNSTVLEDKFMAKNPATFFAEMEKTPLKQNPSPATNFKMPDKDFTVLRKTSSSTSTTTETDVDLLMCTPQLIKEHIHMDKGEDLKKNILALFGEDTDDEESEEDDDQGDLVKLINIPKDSLDFDKLLPHLNKKPQRSKISEEATAAKEVQKLYKFNVFLGNEQGTKSDHSRSTTLSRDERHMARDKERELADSKERTNKTKANTSKGKKAKQTETTHQEDEQSSSNKSGKNKKDEQNISNKPGENREDEQKSSNKPGKNKEDEHTSSNKPGKNKKDEQKSSTKPGKSKEDEPKSLNKPGKRMKDEQKSSNKPGKSKEDEEQNSSNKPGKNKEDEQKSSNKPEKSTRQRKRQASSDKQEKSKEAKKEEPVKEMPARRMTRAKSKYEETASTSKDDASSKNTKSTHDQDDDLDSIATQPYEDDELDSICTQPFVRVTRCRSSSKQSESQDSITTNNSQRKNAQKNKSKNDSSSSHNASVNGNMTTKTTGEQRKRKAEATPPVVPAKIERKRLRSTHSQESSTTSNNSSSASSTISISMTMVDQELFKNLIQNSKGFWNIAKNPFDSEVLVMDKAFRTFKFLLAMARGIPIVTSEYLKKLNKSTTAKKVRINDYLFADAEFEKKHKFSLVKSLQMAKKHKLFKDYEFVMTASILPNPQEIKTIIEVCGGYVHAKTPPAPKENQQIYLVTAKEDKKEWHKYRRLNKNIIIVSTEAIMSAVMRQTCERMTSYMLS